MEIRGTQGRSQSTTQSASGLHNTRVTILNSFYNMEYEIMKENKIGYDVNRSGYSGHKSHTQSVQCTRPQPLSTSIMTSQSIQLRDVTIVTQMTLLRAHMNGTEIVLKSRDRRSNLSLFLYVQELIHGYLIVFISRVSRLNCFSKRWRISLSRILQNND